MEYYACSWVRCRITSECVQVLYSSLKANDRKRWETIINIITWYNGNIMQMQRYSRHAGFLCFFEPISYNGSELCIGHLTFMWIFLSKKKEKTISIQGNDREEPLACDHSPNIAFQTDLWSNPLSMLLIFLPCCHFV